MIEMPAIGQPASNPQVPGAGAAPAGPARILYIQHAGSLGGSCMSLLYTVQALDRRRYQPVIALIRPTEAVARLYQDAGFEVVEWPGIQTLEHTTARWWPLYSPRALLQAGQLVRGWRHTRRRTLDLMAHVRPDLVHLNSVVLAPAALALHAGGVPFVWHVRESAARGHVGLRRHMIGRLLRTLGEEVIFICDDDRQSWVQGRRGAVVYNFVDFERFHPGVDGRALRAQLGIAPGAKVVLYLGGLSAIKGVETLLASIAEVRARVPGSVFLMPGAEQRLPNRLQTRLGHLVRTALGRTSVQGLQRELRALQEAGAVRVLPYQTDIAPYIAASDVLVFPAVKPHFARPVLEAAAMGKPAIGSRIGGVREVLEDGVTGLLVPPGSPRDLAAALHRVLSDEPLARRLGQQAAVLAHARFDSSVNIRQIEEIYCAALRHTAADG